VFEFRSIKYQWMVDREYKIIFVAAYQPTVTASSVKMILERFKYLTPIRFWGHLTDPHLSSKGLAMNELYIKVLIETEIRRFRIFEAKRRLEIPLRSSKVKVKTEGTNGLPANSQLTEESSVPPVKVNSLILAFWSHI